MATTTSNFSWPIPQSTDLVKDGATAIASLGSGIDTSMADLKGGTTGQVLSKTSNTDMDFTWVTTDDANAIQNSIVDAKGDLITATANDTPARLAVGNNGEQLLADSTNTSGLRWTATPNASNPILNSNFSVWQRGTSITTTSGIAYSADRWNSWTWAAGGSMTVSRQVTGDTTNLPNIQYCARVQRVAGNTSTSTLMLGQAFETINSIPFVGKTVTLSFYARKGANYSAASSLVGAQLWSNTTTDGALNTVQSGASLVVNSNSTLTTTWQRFSYSGTIASTATQIAPVFYFDGVGTAGTNDYFEITGVQIDIGNVALPYRAYGATYHAELNACQRYYWRTLAGSAYGAFGIGFATSTTDIRFYVQNPVPMRVVPTGIDSAALQAHIPGTSATLLSNVAIGYGSKGGVDVSATATGFTANRPYLLAANNNVDAYIGFNAEL